MPDRQVTLDHLANAHILGAAQERAAASRSAGCQGLAKSWPTFSEPLADVDQSHIWPIVCQEFVDFGRRCVPIPQNVFQGVMFCDTGVPRPGRDRDTGNPSACPKRGGQEPTSGAEAQEQLWGACRGGGCGGDSWFGSCARTSPQPPATPAPSPARIRELPPSYDKHCLCCNMS